MRASTRTWSVCALGAALALSACAAPDGAEEAVARRAAWDQVITEPLRPDDVEPFLSLGYDGVEPMSWETPGGGFKVWWVTEGPHAARRADANSDGIPDIVEDVGTTADAVLERLDAEGWRRVIPDTELRALGAGNGGDARFDIYLVDFGGNADGAMVRNGCEARGDAVVCSAHFLMENDFSGYGYPSIPEAVGVLVSHEYFHAVQNAYHAELPGWFSEGTATWFEEHFNPDQEDFDRLASLYFDDPGRSLDSGPRGPVDGFSYGASVFFYFLDLRYGWEVIQQTLEETREGDGPLAALDRALTAAGVEGGLIEAFGEFAGWNLFTGDRAIAGVGYPQSASFPGVEALELEAGRGLNWDIEVKSLATQYAYVALSERTSLEVQPLEGRSETPRVYVLNPEDGTLQTMLRPGESAVLEGEAVYLAVVTEQPQADAAGRMAFRRAPAPEPEPEPEPEPDPDPETPAATTGSGSGEEGCAVAPSSPASWGWVFGLGALLLAFRKR